jgi:hypothetical protein
MTSPEKPSNRSCERSSRSGTERIRWPVTKGETPSQTLLAIVPPTCVFSPSAAGRDPYFGTVPHPLEGSISGPRPPAWKSRPTVPRELGGGALSGIPPPAPRSIHQPSPVPSFGRHPAQARAPLECHRPVRTGDLHANATAKLLLT